LLWKIFDCIAVKLEHAGIERQHIPGCGFGGTGGDVAGNRLHIRRQIFRFRNVAEPRRGGGINADFSLYENARAFNTRSKTRARGVRSPIPSPATKVSAAAAKQ
jgi:hypothetical protein